MTKGRVLLVGLEGMDANLVERWAASGGLPTLGMLMEQGSYRRLQNTALLSASVWPAFNIGRWPQSTGLYYSYQWDAVAMRTFRHRWGDSKFPYFWTRLGEQGKRIVVIDAGLAGLQHQSNGVQIAGWQSHDAWHRAESSPPEVMEQVVARFGRKPPGLEESVYGRPRRQATVLAELLSSVRRRTELHLHFLQNENWDLFLADFPEPHRAGHQLWGFPESGGKLSQKTASEPGTAVLEVYQAVDAAVERLLASVPEDTFVLAYSLYGMGPRYGSPHLLAPLLERFDSRIGGARAPGGPTGSQRVSPSRLLRSLVGALPSPIVGMAARALPQSVKTRVRSLLTLGSPDWRRTRFFALPADELGYIRFNLWGREARGIVKPGEEAERLARELSDELAEWVDVHSGAPLVSRIWRTADEFAGPCSADLPDLLVEWTEQLTTDRTRHPRAGLVGGRDPELRAGGHRRDAFLLASGPGVPAGSRPAQAHLLDIPPTVFRLLGLPPHESLEGTPIEDLLAGVDG